MSDDFRPHISHEETIAEITIKSVITGIVFGSLFGAANAYLGLTAGLTISTSIPIAVMAAGFFGLLKKSGIRATILEVNIAQTIGSAASSLASGLIFTMPALFMWGLDPKYLQMVMLGSLGGLLGILFMIPLREYLIIREHGKLPYPEGTASAKILIATEKGGHGAAAVFKGVALGAIFKFCTGFLYLWKSKVAYIFPVPAKASLGLKASPALLGVGYILGFRIAGVMVAGSLISWLVLIPLIAHFGDMVTMPVFPEKELLIAQMSPEQIWGRYIRYIGAGAVAVAGFITVCKSMPIMVSSIRASLGKIVPGSASDKAYLRTHHNIPFKYIACGVLIILVGLTFMPGIIGGHMTVRIMASLAIVIFAFLFVTVSSRIVGIVGVSSNPTSGMALVTMLVTALVFAVLGFTGNVGKIAVLSVGGVVCVAASIAGDVSQDLKTGYILGTTPWKQQVGEMIGTVSAIWAVCFSIFILDKGYTFGTMALPAPQATLIKTVVEGVLSRDLPWGLVLMGGAFAVVVKVIGLPPLPFCVGVYLPISTLTPIFVGGVLRHIIDRKGEAAIEQDADRTDSAILYGSGLIAGEGLIGVGIAAYVLLTARFPGLAWGGIGSAWAGKFESPVALLSVAAILYLLTRQAGTKKA